MQNLPQNEVEMNYIEYEVHFLALFYVQNIKNSMYVQNIPHFNFSFWECKNHRIDWVIKAKQWNFLGTEEILISVASLSCVNVMLNSIASARIPWILQSCRRLHEEGWELKGVACMLWDFITPENTRCYLTGQFIICQLLLLLKYSSWSGFSVLHNFRMWQ